MQIVIDIPKEMYKSALSGYLCGSETLVNAIKNSIPLPKGHGRLIDADALIDTLGCSDRDIYCRATIEEDAKVIIEADSESEKTDADSD